jgi:hypothetical protein
MFGGELSDEYQGKRQFGWWLVMRNVFVVYDVKPMREQADAWQGHMSALRAGALLPHCPGRSGC